MASKTLQVMITGNAKGAQKAFGELDKSAGKATKKTEGAFSKLNGAMLGFGAGAALYGAFSAFDDAQKVMAQTEAVIKSTGGAANVTASEVEGLAGSLSKKSGVDDEAIQSGQNLLLTFKNIRNEAGEGNDVFNQTTAAALDMSVAMGTDMTSASMMLGKALNDPTAGLSKLTKAGVTFTDQQKNQIKTLQASGDTLGAQKVILAELTTEFGGSAEAQATSLGKMKVSLDNMAESIGGALAPAMEVAASGLGKLADAFSLLPQGAQLATLGAAGAAVAWVKFGDGITSVAGTIKSGASGAISSAKAMSDAISQIAATKGVSKGTAAIEVLKSSISGIGAVAPYAAIGIGALAVAYLDLTENSKKASQASQELLDVADRTGSSIEDAFSDKLAKTMAKVTGGFDLGGSGRSLATHLDAMGVSATELEAALLGTDAEFARFKDGLTETARGSHEAAVANVDLSRDIDVLRSAGKNASKSQKDLKAANKELGVSAEDAAGGVGTLSDKQADAAVRSEQAKVSSDRHADSLARIADQAKKATDNITSFYDATTQTIASQIDVEAALDAVTESLKTNGTSLDIGTEKGRANTTAIIGAKDAQVEYAMQLRDTSGSGAAIASMVDYSGKLYDSMVAAGMTKDEAGRLIAQMKLTPKDIYTKFGSNATEAEGKAKAVHQSILNIPGWKDIHFNALTQSALNQIAILSRAVNSVGGSVLNGTAGAAIQQSQAARQGKGTRTGGHVKGGRWNMVGENGPELVQWGDAGTVIPAAQTKSILSGGSMGTAPVYLTVHVQGSVVTERQMVEVVRSGLIDVGRRTGRPVLAGY